MADEPTVIRVRNPEVLELPGIGTFVEHAFSNRLAPTYYKDHFDYFSKLVADPQAGMFVGREGDDYLGLSLVIAFDSPMIDDAHLEYFHNEGSTALRKALLAATKDFVHERGFSTMTTLNRTGHDRSYERLFSREMGDMERLGTLYRFQMPVDDSGPDGVVG